MWAFSNTLRISTKLGIAFGVLLLLTLTLAGFGLWGTYTVHDASHAIVSHWLPSTKEAGEVALSLSDHRRVTFAHVASSDPAAMARYEQQLDEIRGELETTLAEYGARALPEAERQMLAAIGDAVKAYLAEAEKVLALSRRNQNDDAQELMRGDSRQAFYAARASVTRLSEMIAAEEERLSAGADATYTTTMMAITATACVSLLLTLAAGWQLRNAIARPIVAISDAMNALAQGDKTVAVPGIGRGDEVGGMAQAVQVFKDNMIRADSLTAQQQADRHARDRRAHAIERLTGDFQGTVGTLLQGMGTATGRMETTAEGMAANAAHTNQQAMTVASATEQASANVQTVATAAEELSSSIREIGRQVEESSRIAGITAAEARDTDTTMKSLAEVSARIGEVVGLINDIASQTNLLALNATIEAARAGEAGKGFAVVAGEVKSLANQTARATEEIGAQIAAVQGASRQAVAAIGSIVVRIDDMARIAGTIAAAVEEQSAATNEIARNVQQAAAGTQQVADAIGGVTQAAGETGEAAGTVLDAARLLSGQADGLRDAITGFLDGVRTA